MKPENFLYWLTDGGIISLRENFEKGHIIMTKVDIYSGFLGAGKTTLIKKMISEGYKGQKLVLIENEFGEIGIDGGFLQDAGINITEMNSGCICCSLVGDFGKALKKVIAEYSPDRVIIEPSGVGKLSDVINQIETASTIILSRTDSIAQFKLDNAVSMLREHNQVATIITTPWNQLTGEQLVEAMEGKASLAAELAKMEMERLQDEDDDDDGCCCHHHHDEDEDEHEHHHHHHDEDEDEEHEHHHHHDGCCHDHDHEEHEHHHDHDGECCHDHDHEHHHHHHHADEVFTSWGVETAKKFTKEAVETALKGLDTEKYGLVLRAKGILPAEDGSWIHFDYVPEEASIRTGSADITGKLCVIGSKLDEKGIAELFGV